MWDVCIQYFIINLLMKYISCSDTEIMYRIRIFRNYRQKMIRNRNKRKYDCKIFSILRIQRKRSTQTVKEKQRDILMAFSFFSKELRINTRVHLIIVTCIKFSEKERKIIYFFKSLLRKNSVSLDFFQNTYSHILSFKFSSL